MPMSSIMKWISEAHKPLQFIFNSSWPCLCFMDKLHSGKEKVSCVMLSHRRGNIGFLNLELEIGSFVHTDTSDAFLRDRNLRLGVGRYVATR
jgi:hypothetical protein